MKNEAVIKKLTFGGHIANLQDENFLLSGKPDKKNKAKVTKMIIADPGLLINFLFDSGDAEEARAPRTDVIQIDISVSINIDNKDALKHVVDLKIDGGENALDLSDSYNFIVPFTFSGIDFKTADVIFDIQMTYTLIGGQTINLELDSSPGKLENTSSNWQLSPHHFFFQELQGGTPTSVSKNTSTSKINLVTPAFQEIAYGVSGQLECSDFGPNNPVIIGNENSRTETTLIIQEDSPKEAVQSFFLPYPRLVGGNNVPKNDPMDYELFVATKVTFTVDKTKSPNPYDGTVHFYLKNTSERNP